MKKIIITILILIAGNIYSQDAPIGYSTNYGFAKWAQGANPGATALNNNTEKIDSVIYAVATQIGNASNLTTGTLPDARLSSNVPLKNGNSTYIGTNTFNGDTYLTDSYLTGELDVTGNIDITGSYSINGTPIAANNASLLTSGTLADARLSSNVPLKNANNTFTGTTNIFDNPPIFTNGIVLGSANNVVYSDVDNNSVYTNVNSSKEHVFQNLVSATPTQIMAIGEAGVETRALYSSPETISALDINWRLSNTFSKTLSANSTFTFSNTLAGQMITVILTNTASNYTVTWSDASIRWSGGTPPTQTIGAKADVYTFVKIGSIIYGSAIQNFTP
ncbi:MAG TPA: hypothetical protein PL089_14980 [Ignavibacteria bacterium]|nr:hypothetical protein [Ignavibacteria bacterium]